MSDSPVDPRDLRVSDAEREHVVALLQKAIGQGLITLEEFTERTDSALAAKTRSELNAVLLDLPGMTHEDRRAKTAAPAPTSRLELRNTMSKLRRSGDWVVPRELVVRNKMGACDLDFTEALIDHDVVDIHFDVTAGSVRILLPQNASVDVNDLQVAAGKLDNKARAGTGQPRFVLRGIVRAGSVTIKRPTYLRLGNLLIRFPWKVTTDRG
ncbi:DUF1707 domain-containing protein [Kibdelosporangium lantanae]